MKKSFAITVAFYCIFLSGCASLFSAKTAEWPWPNETNPCAADACSEQEALKMYLQANNYCREVQNYYESGGQRANSNKLAIGAVGSLAGAVAAPLASGDAAKAWAGLSGATNALQTSMEEAFSTSVAAKRRKAVKDAAVAGETAYSGATTSGDKVKASINMARSCSMSSAEADTATLKALSQ